MSVCRQQNVPPSVNMALANKNLEEADGKQSVWNLEKGKSAAGKLMDRPKGRNKACWK